MNSMIHGTAGHPVLRCAATSQEIVRTSRPRVQLHDALCVAMNWMPRHMRTVSTSVYSIIPQVMRVTAVYDITP